MPGPSVVWDSDIVQVDLTFTKLGWSVVPWFVLELFVEVAYWKRVGRTGTVCGEVANPEFGEKRRRL